MEDRFYIGQDVVAIKSHSQGIFKEGDCFKVKSLAEGICKCDKLMIDVGIKNTNTTNLHCAYCGCIELMPDNTAWFGSSIFRPLDSLTNIEELTEILEQPIEKLFEVKP